ncbi:glucose-6-phosphate isomerase [Natronomonas pharaonis DSM 2160]|uniref:Probable glucose-6-phosphate isomerase n=1 Tax=Natronomonas pharaonis (strain ATCC 35678 / DSM 2160 / CIP 103997 / JCM 8858 / NBRC 14720 / NCIMB 2260 / Gabara) TaxID=348780 RepID=G6PI_NATPD|nr:glucose-6-phosphate isomerase [Natronomonas pharaonis]Q3IMS0.1 RecName: Full=Probable glucose-6-phosphate isomerase; Short=GPI; AltName: Full=Phosphoglucose isomerase; Short=PGI; AltName: Full=Phosphohexose isomerase; Short=PHI [Natronomonas pharaonis DSM 2160]CAI50587.1 glucose-6-phosphate isomerase [Natronomonas pharaonis DSM 2160]
MNVDFGNALAAEAVTGVSEASLERLDDRVADAHDRIEANIEARRFGYASLALPTDTDPDAIYEAVSGFDPEAVLTVGIGGSALGAETITAALGAESHYTLDNVDPAPTRQLLDELPLSSTLVNVVSRSGTTAETLANFLVVREAMADAGVDWTDRTVVTTGAEGPLRTLADAHDLPSCTVPEGVPGRFSALSAVGLLPAAALGCDIEAVLAGGAAGRESLAPSLFESPAYAYGAVAYATEQRGATTNAIVPYAEQLEPFAEWFAQLWAESLGKDGLGQTPARALGATDQHSQLQLYRAGRKDKLVTLVRPRERAGVDIPETDIDALSYLGGESLESLLDAEFEATEASLAAAGQPNVRIELDSLDAHGVGELLYGMEAACILYGELLGIETFTQPAVEWGKRAARGLLGGGDFEEAEAVADKTVRRVE